MAYGTLIFTLLMVVIFSMATIHVSRFHTLGFGNKRDGKNSSD